MHDQGEKKGEEECQCLPSSLFFLKKKVVHDTFSMCTINQMDRCHGFVCSCYHAQCQFGSSSPWELRLTVIW